MTKLFTLICGLVCLMPYINCTLSVVFFKERTIMFDTSFQLFQILRHNDFAIQVNRFGSAHYTSFSAICFSIKFFVRKPLPSFIRWVINVFYFASFLVVLFVFKNKKMVWVNLLFTIGITTHTFYWIQCELVQGVIFTIIYLAYIEYILQQQKINYWVVYFISFVFNYHCFFSSSVAFCFIVWRMPFYFCNIVFVLKFCLPIVIAFIILYFIKSIFLKTDYDSSAMSGLGNFKWLFPNYFTIQANKNFIRYCLHMIIISFR